ncbi:hypothetical protein TG4357_02392 [Thalassovita gelatinovora]|uniref:N-acetyltransferase domain-containing protein n=1 Tax=Thalassovita gelatinovora TaxID=53501 RepID=A0A0P1FE96_THAGE|nr:hypothetical protein [Thalassovita gelatinovora]QIZ81503.1 hypothetical protein HFZ77_13950 [Thalassovita gelatinovora]CUH66360.1 hypothetical protein TG4357_02392 [Thalassovita gelatinovora]SEQ24557.1 hypothetical protein SAMN04488043_104123 [Thalassovita gelatinovora]
MTIQDVYDGSRYLTETLNTLKSHHLHIEVGDDFETYAQIVKAGRPEQPLGPPFDPEKQFLPAARGVWIIGRNAKGDLVHTQAMRLLDLYDQTLARFLRSRFGEFPPGGMRIDGDGSWFRSGPGADKITGRTVYHGEMWMKDDPAYRGRGLIDQLARFSFLTAMLHWQPDFVFGFILRSVARRGLAEREGYMHCDPYCLSWKVEGRNEPLDCNMVWMAMEDLRHVMHVPMKQMVPAPVEV